MKYFVLFVACVLLAVFVLVPNTIFAATTVAGANLSPASSYVSENINYVLTVQRDGTSTSSGGIRSIEISLPLEFGVPSIGSLSVTCSTPCSKNWVSDGFAAGKIRIHADSDVVANSLKNDDKIDISVNAVSPSVPKSDPGYEWVVAAFSNVGYDGTEYSFPSQPNTDVLEDTQAPIITLIGASTVDLSVGDSYSDAGASATDNLDGDITESIIKGGNFTDTSIAGAFSITYNVSDSSGNAANEIVRAINVTDVTAPSVPTSSSGAMTSNNTGGGGRTRRAQTASLGGEVLGASTSAVDPGFSAVLNQGNSAIEMEIKILQIMAEFLNILRQYYGLG